MPGIYGIISETRQSAGAADALQTAMSAILTQATHFPWYKVGSAAPTPGVALGCVDLGVFNSVPQPLFSPARDVCLVFDGELYHSNSIKKEYQLPVSASDAEVLLAGYLKATERGARWTSDPAGQTKAPGSPGSSDSEGSSGSSITRAAVRDDRSLDRFEEFLNLNWIQGRFSGAIWDQSLRRALLFNDYFGTRPLYYTIAEGRFRFGSDLLTLLTGAKRKPEFDRKGLTQFFTFGQYFNDNTSFEGIKILPPRSLLVYDAQTNRLETRTYADSMAAELAAQARYDGLSREPDDYWIDGAADAFAWSVQKQTNDTQSLGISLSGGLDARSILACVETDQPGKIVSIAMGMGGCADHRLATELARLYGTTHYNYELNTDFMNRYADHFAEMVRLTDGQYLSTSIVIPTLDFYRDKGVRTILRGHAGELMHLSKAYAFSITDPELAGLFDINTVTHWCRKHLQAYMLDGVDRELFRGVSQSDFARLSNESLDQAVGQCVPYPDPASILWQLFLNQRVHREIPLSMKKFGSRIEVRLPFLDRELLRWLYSMPNRLKMGETLEKRILEKNRPEFLTVDNVNTGTKIGASRWRREAAYFRQRVLAKLGVKGYQPYERMGLWLRRELKPIVEKLALGEENLDSGLFNPDTLRWIVSDHNNGANHTYLLVALMVLGQLQKNL